MKPALREALEIEDPTERMLEVAGVVGDELADLDLHPVIVGGLAVAYWTDSAYLTRDIDLLMPHLPEVDERMASLGFEEEGRFWVLPETDIFVEAPGAGLSQGDTTEEVELASGRHLILLRSEDVLLHRLRELVVTPRLDVLHQSLALLGAPHLNRERLHARLDAEGLGSALTVLDELAERVKAGETFESYEIRDLMRKVQEDRVD